MAAVLGANYPDTFAAVAVCAGIPFGAAHSTDSALRVMADGAPSPQNLPGRVLAAMGARKRPVPMFILQGSQDVRVAPINAEHLARQWAGACGLGAEPSETAETAAQAGNRALSRARWLDAQGHTVVERWLIQGLAHAWPGGDASGTHVDPTGPDASAAVWEFFQGRKR
jgi:poly(3-hydroxybutyrate) depolymerase